AHLPPRYLPSSPTRRSSDLIDVDAPLMALAGIWRPRLIVARGLVDALTPEELAASVAHEAGHQRSRDNLKRLVMRAVPDFQVVRSEEHTSELQSRSDLVCRL